MEPKKQHSDQSIIDRVNMDAIEAFCRKIYYCDPYTSMHAEHVADLMAGLATRMLMTSDGINLAYMVGIMHDVGKISIPNEILTKPGRLNEEEFAIMKQHAAEGARMISGIVGVEQIAKVMRHHHERFDGKGYPDGLAGEDIPLFSRMLALCDSFDAMTTKRCYRTPINLPDCLTELERCSGGQFDPAICNSFIDFIKERFG
jgi:HD-GYP domain-containing protein (c-di-GMP phosphodiesterase class II)